MSNFVMRFFLTFFGEKSNIKIEFVHKFLKFHKSQFSEFKKVIKRLKKEENGKSKK